MVELEIAQGYKKEFEKQLNMLIKDGYVSDGKLLSQHVEKGVYYELEMRKGSCCDEYNILVVEGYKKEFEKEKSILLKDGYSPFGDSLPPQFYEKGFLYSQLMSKGTVYNDDYNIIFIN